MTLLSCSQQECNSLVPAMWCWGIIRRNEIFYQYLIKRLEPQKTTWSQNHPVFTYKCTSYFFITSLASREEGYRFCCLLLMADGKLPGSLGLRSECADTPALFNCWILSFILSPAPAPPAQEELLFQCSMCVVTTADALVLWKSSQNKNKQVMTKVFQTSLSVNRNP